MQMDEDLDRAQEVLAEAEALRQDRQALQARLARAQRQLEAEHQYVALQGTPIAPSPVAPYLLPLSASPASTPPGDAALLPPVHSPSLRPPNGRSAGTH